MVDKRWLHILCSFLCKMMEVVESNNSQFSPKFLFFFTLNFCSNVVWIFNNCDLRWPFERLWQFISNIYNMPIREQVTCHFPMHMWEFIWIVSFILIKISSGGRERKQGNKMCRCPAVVSVVIRRRILWNIFFYAFGV